MSVIKKKPVLKKQVNEWPRDVMLKNNTSHRFVDTVTRTLLTPHGAVSVSVSEPQFERIQHNFMQLNLTNRWDNGLEVVDSVGAEDA